MSNTLLPCPFCGGEAKITARDVEPQGDPWYGKNIQTFVICTNCGACLFDDFFHEGFVDEHEATTAWNRRTQPENKPLTNADRIRSMNDEELAKTLTDDDFFYEEICGSDKRTRVCDNDCVVCVLEWLRQPAKEEHNEVD